MHPLSFIWVFILSELRLATGSFKLLLKLNYTYLALAILGLQIAVTPPAYAAQGAPPIPRVKPPPPAPKYSSPAEIATLKAFFNAMDKGNWAIANRKRRDITDPISRRLVDWAYFRKNPADLSYEEVGAYLDANPNWPTPLTIQRHAEKAIPGNAPVKTLSAFFTGREPLTGYGKKALGLMYLKENQPYLAASLLRSAWIEHNWSKSQETAFIQQFEGILRPQDHVAKIDRQLFEIKATASKRLLRYLPPPERAMAEARIALLLRQTKGIALFKALPATARQDPGVLHAVTRYYRKSGQELKAIPYALQAPLTVSTPRFPDKWWTEKKLLGRWALKNGYFDEAYQLSAFSGQTDGSGFAEAEFTAGWIALRFLQDPGRAFEHFAFLDAGVSAPISRARAQYWLGRTKRAEGDEATAQRHFAVAAAFSFTYYGILAQEEISEINSAIPAPIFPQSFNISRYDQAVFDARPQVQAMRLLSEIGRGSEFNAFARQLDDIVETPGEYRAYEHLVRAEGKTFLSVRAGKVAVKNGADVPDVSYPLIFIPDEASSFVETALILGLSRQESEFNPRAYSSAKARGMMQMLSSTARITARKEGIKYTQSELLDNPNYSLILGAAHLSHLLARFEGSYVMTLVGYNAGPNRVQQWIDTYGDPRDPLIDPIDWVELIPFSETRNYVMRVLENVQIYRARLNKGTSIAGNLRKDLVREGGSISTVGVTPSNWVLYEKQVKNQTQSTLLPIIAPLGPPPAHQLAGQIGKRLPIPTATVSAPPAPAIAAPVSPASVPQSPPAKHDDTLLKD